jgi:hypothetical protein
LDLGVSSGLLNGADVDRFSLPGVLVGFISCTLYELLFRYKLQIDEYLIIIMCELVEITNLVETDVDPRLRVSIRVRTRHPSGRSK